MPTQTSSQRPSSASRRGKSPATLDGPLFLDYVAPRLLERQFEDRDRLADDLPRLLALLGRCDEVWVGN
ncbi:MAG: hypothetical protein AAF446_11740, partial [Pseudomonadota bacterium]